MILIGTQHAIPVMVIDSSDMVTYVKPNFVSNAAEPSPEKRKLSIEGELVLREGEPGSLTVKAMAMIIRQISHFLSSNF